MKLIIPADKANHYIVGQAIFCISALACYLPHWGLQPSVSNLISLAIVGVFAVGKEVWDKASGKGTPELRDVVATMLGAVPVSAALALLSN